MLKVIITVHKRADMSDEEFRHYYLESYSPFVAKIPGIKRYIQNSVRHDLKLDNPHLNPGEPSVSGIAEVWFEDLETARASLSSPEAAVAATNLPKFVATERTTITLVDEVEVSL